MSTDAIVTVVVSLTRHSMGTGGHRHALGPARRGREIRVSPRVRHTAQEIKISELASPSLSRAKRKKFFCPIPALLTRLLDLLAISPSMFRVAKYGTYTK